MNDELIGIRAELHALRQVITMIAASMPKDADLVARLRRMEEEARKRNAFSETIEVVRSIRESLE